MNWKHSRGAALSLVNKKQLILKFYIEKGLITIYKIKCFGWHFQFTSTILRYISSTSVHAEVQARMWCHTYGRFSNFFAEKLASLMFSTAKGPNFSFHSQTMPVWTPSVHRRPHQQSGLILLTRTGCDAHQTFKILLCISLKTALSRSSPQVSYGLRGNMANFSSHPGTRCPASVFPSWQTVSSKSNS